MVALGYFDSLGNRMLDHFNGLSSLLSWSLEFDYRKKLYRTVSRVRVSSRYGHKWEMSMGTNQE